jgi:DNA-binding MarR family transcriptional regulator
VPKRIAEEFLDTYGKLKRALSAAAAREYAQIELGSTQVRFLKQIGRSPGISQAELARATDTDPALTGRGLQTLLERGWVRRVRSATDKRAYVLQLGAAGKRMMTRVEATRGKLAERITAPLDEQDGEDFRRIVAKILAGIEAAK